MKLTFSSAVMLVMFFIATGCKNDSSKSNMNNAGSSTEVIAGNDSKTWRSSKETDAQGDKDRLTRDEKKEFITFSTNGTMTMGNNEQTRQGTWKYEGSTLSLQFTGEGVSENFTVLEMDKNTMRLRAADGSEMIMKPE